MFKFKQIKTSYQDVWPSFPKLVIRVRSLSSLWPTEGFFPNNILSLWLREATLRRPSSRFCHLLEATQQLQSELSSLISVASRLLGDKQCGTHLWLKLRNIFCDSAAINLLNVQLKVLLQDAFLLDSSPTTCKLLRRAGLRDGLWDRDVAAAPAGAEDHPADPADSKGSFTRVWSLRHEGSH